MIGEIRKVLTPFYDKKTHRMAFKSRPALLIAKADDLDYIVLPVSSITRRENLDATYDIEVDPAIYPNLNLDKLSYVRTHKQTVIHVGEVGGLIGDMKTDYPDLFTDILAKREQFSEEITDQALT